MTDHYDVVVIRSGAGRGTLAQALAPAEKRIQLLSGDTLSVGQGSLYPALHRLEHQGWIRAEWSPISDVPPSSTR